MDGARRTGSVVGLVDLDIERKADTVAHQFEARAAQEVRDVGARAGQEVLGGQDIGAALEQALAQE